jgi:alpha-D-ribose 1-methylphosphonate 5-triphosphate diphosphatase
VDLAGDLLLPGLVELHTDNMERLLRPRPKVYWPEPAAALAAHDAMVAAAGITTVFDSISLGESVDQSRRILVGLTAEALDRLRGRLRADHLVHLRCEVSDPEMAHLLALVSDRPDVALVSLMDHTPGQRQWRDLEQFRIYYESKSSGADLASLIERLKADRDRHGEAHAALAAAYAAARKVPLASHDDTLPEHVGQAVALGASISEFPTTIEAARAAREAGMQVVMGAPNLVRGLSHSGNVTAKAVASEGLLGALSSDYVPSSLLSGAFALVRECGWSVAGAVAAVSANPAAMARLADRGCLVPGLRADLARVSVVDGLPEVRSVWVAGRRVY